MIGLPSGTTRANAAMACALLVVLATLATPAHAQCEDAKLLSPTGQSFDRFGRRIDMQGDLMVVGMEQDDTIDTNAGTAYVYRHDGASWNLEQQLFASNGGFGHQFGISVALDGDVIVVGALGANGFIGSAYVFRYDGANWNQEAILNPSGASTGDWFGNFVAIDGNVIIGGAPRDFTMFGGNNAGSAYVFRYNGANWIQEANLVASNEGPERLFGECAVEGNVAIIEGGNSAYIFRYNGAAWIEEQNLIASDGQPMSGDVAISGNVVVAAAFRANSFTGAAYVFRYNGATWLEEVKLVPRDPGTNLNFGISVDIEGDVVIAGATRIDDGRGAVYVHRYDGANWPREQKLVASDRIVNDNLGSAVALTGTTVAGCAPEVDDPATSSGALYFFTIGQPFVDCNGDLVDDACDLVIIGDCNTNGLPDDCDIDSGFSLDCNANGVPDDCDISQGTSPDCNANAIPDECDIASGTSLDFNNNFVPDECESFAYNVQLDLFYPTIADAIAAAGTDDDILASPLAVATEATIDFLGKAISVRALGDAATPAAGLVTLADDATFGTTGIAVLTLGGELRIGAGDQSNVTSTQVVVDPTGLLNVQFGGSADVDTGISSTGAVTVFGTLASDGGLLNDVGGALTVSGFLLADTTNDGDATVNGDSYVSGDYTNSGLTTINDGTLTIFGTLTNTGTIVGNVSGGAASSGGPPADFGLAVSGDLVLGAGASLTMPVASLVVRAESSWDVAITDHNDFDLRQAELRLDGPPGPQAVEIMSVDLGPDPLGLDRTLPGHFPLGTLRIGPGPTVVNLVDARDNDGLGQSACEAVYAQTLIIEAGATLNTLGCPVYYESLVLDGTVDDPAALIEIVGVCVADTDGSGAVDILDLLGLLGAWGSGDPLYDFAPAGGDGIVDIQDLLALLANWGPCPG